MSKEIVKDYTITPFEELPTSTVTAMAYTNLNFNLFEIFTNIPITVITPTLTKKKKNINKKELTAPYGAIISVQHSIYIRGIRTSKRKKYWCPVCQLFEEDDEGKMHEILTVEEYVSKMTTPECEEHNLPRGTNKIRFICSQSDCGREFQIRQLRKIVPFLNQVTIVLSIDHVIINIMMFKDNFKLAGNKSIVDANEAIMILWEDYITHIPNAWTFRTIKNVETGEMETFKDAHFLFDLVMRNVDFTLNFSIDKKKLNLLMNRAAFRDRICISQCETTSATHVNIKMKTRKPLNHKYNVLVYDKGGTQRPYFIQVADKLYAKKKKEIDQYTTFIVFSSAEIILTGRYEQDMKEQYEFFVKTAMTNKDAISETIMKPKGSLREYCERNFKTVT